MFLCQFHALLISVFQVKVHVLFYDVFPFGCNAFVKEQLVLHLAHC